jgi:hypothetical protein
MRVAVAPDKFKGSLTAAQVAARVAAGLARAAPARCMTEAGPLLERLADRVASDWVTDDAREMTSP